MQYLPQVWSKLCTSAQMDLDKGGTQFNPLSNQPTTWQLSLPTDTHWLSRRPGEKCKSFLLQGVSALESPAFGGEQ